MNQFFGEGGNRTEYPAKTLEVRLRSTETQATNYICSRGEIDDHNASLTSQGVQRGRFPRCHPSSYQHRLTELNFGEQTGTGVLPLVQAVQLAICHG